MTSLSEKISLLANPTPTYLDPEDDVNIETAAKTKSLSSDNDGVIFMKSELRSKAAVLDDRDPAYIGKKVSRKSLDRIFQNDSGEDIDSEDEDEKEEQSDDDDDDDHNLEDFKQSLNQKVLSGDESEQNEESSESEISDEDNSGNTADMVAQFSHFDVKSEIEKGAAVKEQLEIINRLCETRIRLQKLLVVSRTFPQKECWNTAKEDGGEEMIECMNKASKAAENTLNSCLDFQLEYFKKISDNQENNRQNDEEICSDTDEEAEKCKDNKKSQKPKKVSKRKLNSHQYAKMLAEHLTDLTPYRNSVLQTWDEKTKLSSGKITQKSFAAFESSVIKQIEQILQDKDRLIKRTQLKRSLFKVVGKPDTSENKKDDAENSKSVSKQDMLLRDYDPEIFDDDDFYRQFLRDVIESKSVGIDPVHLRKQMEIQSIRSKIRKKVDTKASKGRKIRYDVDPKIAGFAIAEHNLADPARDSILKSLCGGAYVDVS